MLYSSIVEPTSISKLSLAKFRLFDWVLVLLNFKYFSIGFVYPRLWASYVKGMKILSLDMSCSISKVWVNFSRALFSGSDL